MVPGPGPTHHVVTYGAGVAGVPTDLAAVTPAPPRLPDRLQSQLDPDVDPEFPDLERVLLTGSRLTYPTARRISVLRSRLVDCTIDDRTDATLDAVDSEFEDMDLTGRRINDLRRVGFTRCRLGGADLGDAHLRDVRFDECVLDLASMRAAILERVTVSGGRVAGVDLTGAELRDVTFAGVELAEVALDGSRLERVDLTGADLTGVVDLSTLRGAAISEVQAISLAARLASAAGISVVSA